MPPQMTWMHKKEASSLFEWKNFAKIQKKIAKIQFFFAKIQIKVASMRTYLLRKVR